MFCNFVILWSAHLVAWSWFLELGWDMLMGLLCKFSMCLKRMWVLCMVQTTIHVHLISFSNDMVWTWVILFFFFCGAGDQSQSLVPAIPLTYSSAQTWVMLICLTYNYWMMYIKILHNDHIFLNFSLSFDQILFVIFWDQITQSR